MEAYLDGIPRSTSSGSIAESSNSTSNSHNNANNNNNGHSTSSSFWLGGISSVWSGLKAAAGVEVKGFLKAVNSGFASGGATETANTGDKRSRRSSIEDMSGSRDGSERAREKRRRIEHDELLNDQVPPLMPPISPAPRSRYQTSSPFDDSRKPASSSPENTRKRLRPYTDSSYADELMYNDQFAPSHSRKNSTSDKSGGGIRSLSGRRRLDANGTAKSTQDTGVTTAMSSSRNRSVLQHGVHSQNHVKFAFPPTASTPGLAKPKSPTSRLPKRDNPDQVGSMLMGNVVGQVWKEAKEKEKSLKTQRKIDDLENEVQRLKTELSSKANLVPPSLPAPPKSPRRSAPPPPPPAPPLPPVGRPSAHPVLFTARASLRATPPRPSHKRRSSAIGGVPDMDAFLGELGEKRGKLRKVGFPSASKERQSKKGEGELTEVLQKAFARKFAKSNGLASPSFDTPVQTSKSSSNLQVPQWSQGSAAPHSTITTSRSHPTQLSSLGSPSLALPPQPIFRSSSSSSSLSDSAPAARLPRSTSLACTETTVFGQAVTIDEPSLPQSRSASHSHDLFLATTEFSPSLSASSLPTAPPEPSASRPSSSKSPPDDSPRKSPRSLTTPARVTIKMQEGGDSGDPSESASKRLSAARKRTSLERLPGLDAGSKRPVTPGRSRSKSNRKNTGGSSPLVVVKVEDTEERNVLSSPQTLNQENLENDSPCEVLLQGSGTKNPSPRRPFGKA